MLSVFYGLMPSAAQLTYLTLGEVVIFSNFFHMCISLCVEEREGGKAGRRKEKRMDEQ